MCNFTHLKSHWHYFWNTMATGNVEKWCKGDQTWGIVKEKPPVLTLRNKIKWNQWCLQKCVFCFTWQHLLPNHSSFTITNSSGRSTKHRVSQLSVHCILLLTRNWTFFFSLISFPSLYLWNLSGRIKIDQGLLLLIKSTIWLHFTEIQTLWLSLSQHPSLWLWKTCFPWLSLTYRWNPRFFDCITPNSHKPHKNKAAVKRKLEGGGF